MSVFNFKMSNLLKRKFKEVGINESRIRQFELHIYQPVLILHKLTHSIRLLAETC